jgi:IstB-like ATP binding protein
LLLAEEITVRESRRIKAALQMARLGHTKTPSGFDFSFQPFGSSKTCAPIDRDHPHMHLRQP